MYVCCTANVVLRWGGRKKQQKIWKHYCATVILLWRIRAGADVEANILYLWKYCYTLILCRGRSAGKQNLMHCSSTHPLLSPCGVVGTSWCVCLTELCELLSYAVSSGQKRVSVVPYNSDNVLVIRFFFCACNLSGSHWHKNFLLIVFIEGLARPVLNDLTRPLLRRERN